MHYYYNSLKTYEIYTTEFNAEHTHIFMATSLWSIEGKKT